MIVVAIFRTLACQFYRVCQLQVCNLIHSCSVRGREWFGSLTGRKGMRKSSSVTYSWIFFCGCGRLERCACAALRLSVILSAEFTLNMLAQVRCKRCRGTEEMLERWLRNARMQEMCCEAKPRSVNKSFGDALLASFSCDKPYRGRILWRA